MEAHYFAIVAVAIVIGAICRSRKINPALPLIVAGFLMEEVHGDLVRSIEPEVVLTLILAPLVFAAGLASSAVDLRRIRRRVLLLAVGLVVITTLVVGFASALVIATLPLSAAFALGAVLAPTDVVAASAVASKTRLPRQVLLVIEGESLANDGTALTILRVAITATVAGAVTLLQATGILIAAVGVGLVVGGLGGMLVSWLMRLTSQPVVANAILLLTPFGLYAVSEELGGSGLLTVVLAGVWIAHTTELGPSYQARLQARSVWSLVTFVLESVAFLLVGIEFVDTVTQTGAPTGKVLGLAVLITVLLFVTRAIFMAVWLLIGPRFAANVFADKRSTAKEFIAITLLGVRGPVSVLAVFSIPLITDAGTAFPDRNLITALTFYVVLLSLCSSLLAAPLIARLNLTSGNEEEDRRYVESQVAKAALRRLDELIVEAEQEGEPLHETTAQRLRSTAVRRIEALQGEPDQLAQAADHSALQRRLQHMMLAAEREELARLVSLRRCSGDIVRELSHEMDIREAALANAPR